MSGPQGIAQVLLVPGRRQAVALAVNQVPAVLLAAVPALVGQAPVPVRLVHRRAGRALALLVPVLVVQVQVALALVDHLQAHRARAHKGDL